MRDLIAGPAQTLSRFTIGHTTTISLSWVQKRETAWGMCVNVEGWHNKCRIVKQFVFLLIFNMILANNAMIIA